MAEALWFLFGCLVGAMFMASANPKQENRDAWGAIVHDMSDGLLPGESASVALTVCKNEDGDVESDGGLVEPQNYRMN